MFSKAQYVAESGLSSSLTQAALLSSVKCCIKISVNSTKTVSKTDYQVLDESKTNTPTKEQTDLFKDAGSAGGCISLFVPENFQQDGKTEKDISGGGATYDAGKSDAKIVVVEGVNSTVVAHELGHAMGYVQHVPAGTVMEPSRAHNKPVKRKVTKGICNTVRSFTGAKDSGKDCKLSKEAST